MGTRANNFVMCTNFKDLAYYLPQIYFSGTSNTGNVMRRCLDEPVLLSELLSSDTVTIPAELITRIGDLWTAISASGIQICPQKLRQYCQETEDIYFAHELDYYPFCSSVHKLRVAFKPDALSKLCSKIHIDCLNIL